MRLYSLRLYREFLLGYTFSIPATHIRQAGIEELKDIPVVEALIGDFNKAFAEVKKSSIINRKSLVTAHNILHDLEGIWWKTEALPYGVASEKTK